MFEGDGGWSTKPPPLEYQAGPGNPWAKCAGKGSGNKPSKSLPGFKPPKLPEPSSSAGRQVAIDGSQWALGTSVKAGAAKLAAVTGSVVQNHVSGEFIRSLIDWSWIISWIIWIMRTGSVSDGAMIGAVDPPAPDYAKRVAPPALRRIDLPQGSSKAAQEMVRALAGLEQTALGEVEIIDRARSAGQAGDGRAYHDQVGDLFMVQTLKNERMRAATAALREATHEAKDLLTGVGVPSGAPLRDLVAPVYALRPQLEDIGLSAAELNAALYHFRVPSPLLDACEDYVQAHIAKTGGDCVAMVNALADDLEGLDFVDLAPFDDPPKT